jgi:hypothetical protein
VSEKGNDMKDALGHGSDAHGGAAYTDAHHAARRAIQKAPNDVNDYSESVLRAAVRKKLH